MNSDPCSNLAVLEINLAKRNQILLKQLEQMLLQYIIKHSFSIRCSSWRH